MAVKAGRSQRSILSEADAQTLGQVRHMEAFFSCFPPPSDCEWHAVVRDFSLEYNRLRGTDFQPKSCLDRSSSSTKEPEILLTCSDDRMVVERKTVVSPGDFLHAHSKAHEMADYLLKNLADSPRLPLTVSLIQASNAPYIDEVWIATKRWVSQDEFRIGWVPYGSGT